MPNLADDDRSRLVCWPVLAIPSRSGGASVGGGQVPCVGDLSYLGEESSTRRLDLVS